MINVEWSTGHREPRKGRLLVLTHFLLSSVRTFFPNRSMYNLPYYKEKDQQVVIDFIHQHPFAFIAGCTEEGKPVASQVPVFIEER